MTVPTLSAFLESLYAMVNDPDCKHLIDWTENGDSFLVTDRNQFEQEILPKFFKHRKFSSFIRQLNMYGFHKVGDPKHWEFVHERFLRGRYDLLFDIKRKAGQHHHSAASKAAMKAAKARMGRGRGSSSSSGKRGSRPRASSSPAGEGPGLRINTGMGGGGGGGGGMNTGSHLAAGGGGRVRAASTGMSNFGDYGPLASQNEFCAPTGPGPSSRSSFAAGRGLYIQAQTSPAPVHYATPISGSSPTSQNNFSQQQQQQQQQYQQGGGGAVAGGMYQNHSPVGYGLPSYPTGYGSGPNGSSPLFMVNSPTTSMSPSSAHLDVYSPLSPQPPSLIQGGSGSVGASPSGSAPVVYYNPATGAYYGTGGGGGDMGGTVPSIRAMRSSSPCSPGGSRKRQHSGNEYGATASAVAAANAAADSGYLALAHSFTSMSVHSPTSPNFPVPGGNVPRHHVVAAASYASGDEHMGTYSPTSPLVTGSSAAGGPGGASGGASYGLVDLPVKAEPQAKRRRMSNASDEPPMASYAGVNTSHSPSSPLSIDANALRSRSDNAVALLDPVSPHAQFVPAYSTSAPDSASPALTLISGPYTDPVAAAAAASANSLAGGFTMSASVPSTPTDGSIPGAPADYDLPTLAQQQQNSDTGGGGVGKGFAVAPAYAVAGVGSNTSNTGNTSNTSNTGNGSSTTTSTNKKDGSPPSDRGDLGSTTATSAATGGASRSGLSSSTTSPQSPLNSHTPGLTIDCDTTAATAIGAPTPNDELSPAFALVPSLPPSETDEEWIAGVFA